jgi:hypothetical protein
MPSDSDPVVVYTRPDAMMTVVTDVIQGVEFKFITLLFLLYLIIHSDVFIEKILSKASNATYMKYPTTYGTMLQGLLLCGSAIAVQCLMKAQVI